MIISISLVKTGETLDKFTRDLRGFIRSRPDIHSKLAILIQEYLELIKGQQLNY